MHTTIEQWQPRAKNVYTIIMRTHFRVLLVNPGRRSQSSKTYTLTHNRTQHAHTHFTVAHGKLTVLLALTSVAYTHTHTHRVVAFLQRLHEFRSTIRPRLWYRTLARKKYYPGDRNVQVSIEII